MDYEELVKFLRSESCVPYTTLKTMREAADAIEELEFACNRYEKDYKDLCAYLPKWIPVTERLPENGKYVLCFCRANIVCVLRRDKDGDWYENPTHVYMSHFVTHWMPLPKPPKEET